MATCPKLIKSSDTVPLEGILSGHCLNDWVVRNIELTDREESVIQILFSALDLASKLEPYKLIEVPKEGLPALIAEIDRIVADPDSYEDGEEHPSAVAIATMKELLAQASDIGASFPKSALVSAFHGELDATWRASNKTLRLIAYSNDRLPLLYFCTDSGEALTRGQSIRPVTAQQLSERLAWLVG
jgi:hypothetical protein